MSVKTVYVLFQAGEEAHGGERIVRVGTHTDRKQLRSRLKQHFLQENKDRSIFRKNIGRALLNKVSDAFSAQWELDLTSHVNKLKYAALIDGQKLHATEQSVSARFRGTFRFARDFGAFMPTARSTGRFANRSADRRTATSWKESFVPA
jgi:hypothetical protein